MNLYNTEMYNKSQKKNDNENENIFDKQMKSGKLNKTPAERNTFEANNIADTNTSDAFLSNTGRRGKFADESDNELFKTKEYSKIMKSIETEGSTCTIRLKRTIPSHLNCMKIQNRTMMISMN